MQAPRTGIEGSRRRIGRVIFEWIIIEPRFGCVKDPWGTPGTKVFARRSLWQARDTHFNAEDESSVKPLQGFDRTDRPFLPIALVKI